MKENIDYLKDLRDVKQLMEKSSKFISLSGLSGVMAGFYALLCAGVVYFDIYETKSFGGETFRLLIDTPDNRFKMFLYGSITLILAVGTGFYLTMQKAKKKNVKVFNKAAYQLFYSLLTPLFVGGIICLIMINRGEVLYIAPMTLVFYGLALINASAYTFNDIKGLGYIQCLLGIVSAYFIGYGILFWGLGFGVCHIAYGMIMYRKYD
ncbi:MAG: hypothetical protein WBA74_10635, partial [Cyclobacteriaceae bacterium]